MFILLIITAVLTGYLLAGINPSIIFSKAVFNEDIRKKGSGNPGFTNFKRVYGNRPISWLVLFLDMFKTAGPILLFALLFSRIFDMWQFGAALTGFACMLGHAFPIWYDFKGGKSFIAGFTTTWFVDWRIGLIFLVMFLIMVFTIRYMSLCSMIATLLYPLMLPILGVSSIYVEILAILSAALVIWRHKPNIKKLIEGTESKFYLKSKTS